MEGRDGTMAVDRYKVESFLYREARLMDAHAYNEWLSLWADDALYWVPCNEDDLDPMQHVSFIYEDRPLLEDRIWRLKSEVAWSQQPRSRTRRVISNVELEESEDGEVTARSNFILIELRRGKQDTFAGSTIHKLRPEGDSFKISFKKVLLVNNDEPMDNLTFLL